MSWDLQPQPQQGKKNFVSVVQYTTTYETFSHRFVYKMMKYNSCAGNQSQTKKLLEEIAQKSLTSMIYQLEYKLVTYKFCITFVIFSNMLSVEWRNWHQFQTKKFLEKCPSLQSNSNLVANNPFLRSIAIADCITVFTLSE